MTLTSECSCLRPVGGKHCFKQTFVLHERCRWLATKGKVFQPTFRRFHISITRAGCGLKTSKTRLAYNRILKLIRLIHERIREELPIMLKLGYPHSVPSRRRITSIEFSTTVQKRLSALHISFDEKSVSIVHVLS